MEYVRLGNTGLKVSPLCVGCMSFGAPDKGAHPWVLNEQDSRPIFKRAVEAGINFFDTANAYSAGTSEEITGKLMKEYTKRDETVLATKVHFNWRDAPNTGGLSRKAILQACDDSLRRLGTDYIDLYQIHRFDYETPIEETLHALHDLVKSGKVRYIGASSMHTWQFAKYLYTADQLGLTRFISMQNYVNLLYREEEREMIPFCRDQGIGIIPWSPLARGKLTREWDATTDRSQSDEFGKYIFKRIGEADKNVFDRVDAIAQNHNVPRAQIALAWLLQKPGITSPIVGATKESHLADAIAALDITLTPEEVKELEKPYIPHRTTGHI